MRNKIYSEKRRKIHSLFNQVLKHSFIAKLIHKNQLSNNLEIDPHTGIYNQFAINTYLKELHPQTESNFGIVYSVWITGVKSRINTIQKSHIRL